jgi:hypothetical protein
MAGIYLNSTCCSKNNVQLELALNRAGQDRDSLDLDTFSKSFRKLKGPSNYNLFEFGRLRLETAGNFPMA